MTGATCIGEPVSWLRLEQLALGELAAPTADAVTTHLAACAACAQCLDAIRADQVALPALPAIEPARVPWWRRRAVWGVAAGLAAAAAVLLIVLRPPPKLVEHEVVGQEIRLKGGDVLVVGLVRDRAGTTTMAPTGFASGDRFKLLVTCSKAVEVWADIMVLQPERAGEPMVASYPADAVRVTCGNQVPLPGAFTITGGGPASVCLAVDPDQPPTREKLGRRREGIACYQLLAE